MEIKTKFNIGDTVFFIKDGRVRSGNIGCISVIQNTNNMTKLESGEIFARNISTVIQYYIGADYYSEYMVASSKEELIKSLIYETDNDK